MKNLLIILFILIGWSSYSSADPIWQSLTLANAQTTTGASAVTCPMLGSIATSVRIAITGTASVDLECSLDDVSWTALSGGGLPATSTILVGISGYACKSLRSNVASCSSCSVTSVCTFWRAR